MARVALLLLAALPLGACARRSALGWNPPAAAHYLDRRAQQWIDWPKAARAQHTVCISCHTALPYLLSRSSLAGLTGEATEPAPQRLLLADVGRRVQLWGRLPPYYPDQAAASRGTESVLNALILADRDARVGRLSTTTLAAFDAMWALQRSGGPEGGSWPWLEFQSEPWEAPDSVYYGATLAALAVGSAPQDYRLRPQIQAGLARLRDYLTRAYARQGLLNRVDLLWAAARLPGLVQPPIRQSILEQIWAQQRADGGWSLPSLMPGWRRRDGTPQSSHSDGYATGFIALVLQRSGVPGTDARLQRALQWLQTHQSFWTGRWSSDSLNHRHGLRAGTARHFMDDAATAFAVLALTQARVD